MREITSRAATFGPNVYQVNFGDLLTISGSYTNQLPMGASTNTYAFTLTAKNTTSEFNITSATITFAPSVDKDLSDAGWALGLSSSDYVPSLSSNKLPLSVVSSPLSPGNSTTLYVVYYGIIAAGKYTNNIQGNWTITPSLSLTLVPIDGATAPNPSDLGGQVK
ncbi:MULTISPECIES: hypothetical protein [Sorangium]|uniref:Uncharacterized protein n=1 Tax=Sorangium cellulosum (strain So ce56) TaxID=448385 RepID=A9GM86_SORC5|nr:hypothetical protein [Sorangium cellulosum]CAN90385.1 hypothetical protein predicted by Glimmer/Critica [Sorangium cellulosum So ce56]